ncbi:MULTISPECIES: hypothetical protein [Paraburkholderia]|nr:hypothetical protein [Paraburkholderia youngii]
MGSAGDISAAAYFRACRVIQDFLTPGSGFAVVICSRRRLCASARSSIIGEACEDRKAMCKMIADFLDRRRRLQEIDRICQRLFETWCEARSLTPLTYLLFCWPLRDTRPVAIRRLQQTLKELRRDHAEGFDAGTFVALDQLVDRLDELVDRAETPVTFSLVT